MGIVILKNIHILSLIPSEDSEVAYIELFYESRENDKFIIPFWCIYAPIDKIKSSFLLLKEGIEYGFY